MNIETINKQGISLYLEGNYEKALDVFQRVLDINTRHELAYLYMARTYDALGDYSKAIDLFQKLESISIVLKKHEPTDIYFFMGLSYLNLKNYRIAKKYFEKDRTYNSEKISGYRALFYNAVCHMYLGKYTTAIEGFEGIIKSRYNDIDSLNNKASCHIELGEYDLAYELLIRALKIRENPVSYFNLGILEKSRGDHKKSIEFLSRAKQLNPKFS